jgi:hypothetical protein
MLTWECGAQLKCRWASFAPVCHRLDLSSATSSPPCSHRPITKLLHLLRCLKSREPRIKVVLHASICPISRRYKMETHSCSWWNWTRGMEVTRSERKQRRVILVLRFKCDQRIMFALLFKVYIYIKIMKTFVRLKTSRQVWNFHAKLQPPLP